MTNGFHVRKFFAELIGTFWLVFAGCGSAVLAGKVFASGTATGSFQIGIGYLGVAIAFGLTVLTMVYAFGHISGGHFNPAVTLGLWLGKRAETRDVLPYIVTQVVAAIVASSVLYALASGKSGFDAQNGFAANGYGSHSPDGYNLASCFVAEVVFTAIFLLAILGATDRRAPKGFAPLAIGLTLTLIHLVTIPLTNTSVNPARSTGPALFVGGWATSQLWMFWVAPLLGGAIAGLAYRYITGETGVELVAEAGQEPEAAVIAAGETAYPDERREQVRRPGTPAT